MIDFLAAGITDICNIFANRKKERLKKSIDWRTQTHGFLR